VMSGNLATHALLAKNDALLMLNKGSDTWNEYQSKSASRSIFWRVESVRAKVGIHKDAPNAAGKEEDACDIEFERISCC